MTLEEELALVNTLLQQAASSGGVAEWQESQHKVKHYSIRELVAWKRDIESQLTQSTTSIYLPIREVDV